MWISAFIFIEYENHRRFDAFAHRTENIGFTKYRRILKIFRREYSVLIRAQERDLGFNG